MNLKIKHKLFLALLFTSVVVSLALHFFVKLSFERGFKDYVRGQETEQIGQLSEELTAYYQREGNWKFIVGNHVLWRKLHHETSPASMVMQEEKGGEPPYVGGPPVGPEGDLGGPEGDPSGIGRRIALFDADLHLVIGGGGDPQSELKMVPMILKDSTIGYLGLKDCLPGIVIF